jgi:hypothetical protein
MKIKLSVIGIIVVFSALGLVTYHLEMAYAQPPPPSSLLVGKWNFVVVVKNASISGTVTFVPNGSFSETSAGHTVGGTYKYTAGVLNYCFRQGCVQYSQMEGNDMSGMPGMNMNMNMNNNNNNHIELHAANDIVYHLMR